jgi:DNA-binding LacI/PurR family transcriptional regulator
MTRGRPSVTRPTIYDVAERAGVSKSLVSLVLQNAPQVSEKRRRAVLAAIADLGYRPSSAASSLAGTRSRTVGVAIDDFENLWFVDLLRGMRQVFDESGHHVSVADSHADAPLARDPVDAFLSMRVEGIVLAMETTATVPAFGGVPVLVAGARDVAPPGADLVANDDEEGARLATWHLLRLGHRDIGHLTGAGGVATLRRNSYAATMAEAGLEAVVTGDGGTTEQDGYLAAQALLDVRPQVTGIFAANDVMLLGALAALRERRLAVPDDVSVVGYDNSPLAASHYLALTTVDDRSVDVGIQVAQSILARHDDPGRAPSHIMLSPTLVQRASTSAVRCRTGSRHGP